MGTKHSKLLFRVTTPKGVLVGYRRTTKAARLLAEQHAPRTVWRRNSYEQPWTLLFHVTAKRRAKLTGASKAVPPHPMLRSANYVVTDTTGQERGFITLRPAVACARATTVHSARTLWAHKPDKTYHPVQCPLGGVVWPPQVKPPAPPKARPLPRSPYIVVTPAGARVGRCRTLQAARLVAGQGKGARSVWQWHPATQAYAPV